MAFEFELLLILSFVFHFHTLSKKHTLTALIMRVSKYDGLACIREQTKSPCGIYS